MRDVAVVSAAGTLGTRCLLLHVHFLSKLLTAPGPLWTFAGVDRSHGVLIA